MKLVPTLARTAGNKWTALTLLVCSLLLPVAPILEASARSKMEDCQCCRRAGKKCDPKSHRRSSDGPSWTASPDCQKACAQPVSAPLPILIFGAESRSAANLPRSAPADLVATGPDHAASSYSVWLYQRPPPRT
jgi:hypothetical protein